MALYRIVMRLARNPGTHHAEADDHRGYTIVAPLTADARLDEDAFRKHRDACTVRRFAPDEEPQVGHLHRHGQRWAFDYGDRAEGEEPVYRLGDHRFALGEYVSVTDEDGELLTYKVTEVTAVEAASA